MNIIEYSFVFSCYFIPGVADEIEYNIVCLSAAGHGHRTFLDAGIARCDIVFHTDVGDASFHSPVYRVVAIHIGRNILKSLLIRCGKDRSEDRVDATRQLSTQRRTSHWCFSRYSLGVLPT